MAASWYFIYRLYLYETSRNIQEPWPPGLYFTVCWLQTLADFPWLIFLSSVDSWALLMVASWYFIRGFTSVRPAASAFMPNVHAWAGARGQYLGHHNFCLISQRLVDGWILYLGYWFSVTHWPKTMYVGQWPIFHGPVILPYLGIWIIYLFLPILACWGLIWKYLWI